MKAASPASAAPTIHGTAAIVGETGVLIRGRSGAGKSRLAELLVEAAQARGWFGRLVADDRVRLRTCGGRLVLSPHPATAGLVERRGQGIMPVPHEGAVVLGLVVELVDKDAATDRPPRYPTATDGSVTLDGVQAPRIIVAVGDEGAPAAILRLIFARGAQNVG